MQQEKGNIALLILVLILTVGLALGLFLVQQKTNLLPKAYFPSSQTKQEEPAKQEQYQNPFDDTSSNNNSTNIFSGYQNPFEGLK